MTETLGSSFKFGLRGCESLRPGPQWPIQLLMTRRMWLAIWHHKPPAPLPAAPAWCTGPQPGSPGNVQPAAACSAGANHWILIEMFNAHNRHQYLWLINTSNLAGESLTLLTTIFQQYYSIPSTVENVHLTIQLAKCAVILCNLCDACSNSDQFSQY